MNLFDKLYFERCKEEFGSLGFIRSGNFFERIVNDNVIQSFYLQKWGNGYKCEIHFGISPMCRGENPGCPSPNYSLSKFAYKIQDPWICKGEDQEVADGVENVISDIKKYIMPSFERATDPASAFNEIIYLDKLVYQLISERNGDRAFSSEILEKSAVKMNDNAKYFFALKKEDYKFAAKCLEAFLSEQIYIYLNCKACCEKNENYPKENLISCEKTIEELKKEISFIENGEYEYFKNIVEENEKKNRLLYKKFYK